MKEPNWEFIRGVCAICTTQYSTYALPGDSFTIAGYLDDECSGNRLLILHNGEGAELFAAHWSHFKFLEAGSK